MSVTFAQLKCVHCVNVQWYHSALSAYIARSLTTALISFGYVCDRLRPHQWRHVAPNTHQYQLKSVELEQMNAD